MFKYSNKDGILVVLGLLHIASWILPVIFYQDLSITQLILFGALNVFLMSTNYECIAHNFMHNPFFKSKVLNIVYGILNSIAMGMPQCIYRSEHNMHHICNNDPWVDGNPPKDTTSTYYNGKDGKEESVWTYTFYSYFRLSLPEMTKDALKLSGKQVHVEWLFIAVFFFCLALIEPAAFLFWIVPVHYLGTCVAALENYAEHNKCDPRNKKANSVSVYNPIYNKLWFNNGYHQEHHCNPKVHWTDIPQKRANMLDESERRIVPGLHLVGLFINDTPIDQKAQGETPSPIAK